jgi:arylsulfatase
MKFNSTVTAKVAALVMLVGMTSTQAATPTPASAGLVAAAATAAPQAAAAEDPRMAGFKGKIAMRYEDAREDWPQRPKAPAGAPNVLLILLDDVGYAQIGSFGGLVQTPNIDALAADGLRYTNFHTAALCSPSRAAIAAGRNHHSIGMGSHAVTAMGFPGYNGFVPPQAAPAAKILQEDGFTTYALGKWDHTPQWEVNSTGPFNGWPSDEGYDHYYGFMSADIHNFVPIMYNDHWPSNPAAGNPGYNLTRDMADRAEYWITSQVSSAPDRPFMMFFATPGVHAPHHADRKYLDLYRGKFDMGWDVAREQILANQIRLGIMPAGTRLAQHTADIPDWNTLSAEQKKMYARQMEAFAAMLTQTDDEIGRIIATLKRTGQYDNTLILVTSDNGASGEGGLEGTHNEALFFNGYPKTPFAENMKHYDDWGTAETNNHYHAGWAMAGNTPFKHFKQSAHNGGMTDALIVTWPKGIRGRGELRTQYHHIIDIAPTILEATHVAAPAVVDGVRQMPFDGVSMVYSFNDPKAASTHQTQYYEIWGNRGIYDHGWKAVALHGGRMPWQLGGVVDFDKDVWELYDLEADPTETNDLAASNPARLEEMKKLFEQEAWKYNVYPLYDDVSTRVANVTKLFLGDKSHFTFYPPGAEFIAEAVSPPTKNRSHSITATLSANAKTNGVIAACGGYLGGYTLFVKDNILTYTYNFLDEKYYTIRAGKPLTAGEHVVRMVYDKLPDKTGKVTLTIDGAVVGQGIVEQEEVAKFSPGSETFDVGSDNGGAVDRRAYAAPFRFTGRLDKVEFDLVPVGQQARNSEFEADAQESAVD